MKLGIVGSGHTCNRFDYDTFLWFDSMLNLTDNWTMLIRANRNNNRFDL